MKALYRNLLIDFLNPGRVDENKFEDAGYNNMKARGDNCDNDLAGGDGVPLSTNNDIDYSVQMLVNPNVKKI